MLSYVRAKRIFEASEAGNIAQLQEMKTIRNGGARASPDLPDIVAGANGVEEARFTIVGYSPTRLVGTSPQQAL